MFKSTWQWIRSWFKPSDERVMILAGDDAKIDLTGWTQEEICNISKRDQHLAKYYPWPESYFILVGTSLKEETKAVLYRMKDPVSGKEFILSRDVLNILFFRK